ncbi:MAG: lysostaphin resistance A-like protein [Cryomorphaceae bacterium]
MRADQESGKMQLVGWIRFKASIDWKTQRGIIPFLIILALLVRFWTDSIHYFTEFTEVDYLDPLDFSGVPIPYFVTHGINVIILIPVIEELVFRGIMLDNLLKRNYNAILAIVISSFFFALIHIKPLDVLNSIPSASGAFLFGIVAGLIYQKTRNLHLVILMHCTANLYSFIFSDIYFSEYWNLIIRFNLWLYLILVLATIVLSILMIKIVLSTYLKGLKNND